MAFNAPSPFQIEMSQRPAVDVELTEHPLSAADHNDDKCCKLEFIHEYLRSVQHYQQPLSIERQTLPNTVDGEQLDVEHIRSDQYVQTPNASSASTLEGSEAKLSPTDDDQFAYLRSLNSDNLMKFSQQSALQKMLNEEISIKPNINMLPTFEEHDQAGYNFHINVNASERGMRGGKTSVVYSEALNKLYIRMNENVYIDAQYTLKMPMQPLRIRVFMVYSKDVSEPVLRCQNHLCKDENESLIVKQSLIRCENADIEYCGSELGKNVKERFSVVIPMNTCVKSEENKYQVKKQMLFNFTCHNSCMGRRETTAVFILENFNGEILAQRLLHVKICTCPRRDKCADERPAGDNVGSGSRKRRIALDGNLHSEDSTKHLKLEENSCPRNDFSRSSLEDGSIYGGGGDCIEEPYGIHRDKDKFVLTVKFTNRHKILEVIEQLYANAKKSEDLHQKSCDSRSLKRFYAKVLAFK